MEQTNIKNIRGRGFSSLWIIIIVALIGLAAVVAFGVLDVAKIKKPSIQTSDVDQKVQELNTLSTSDEIDAIEKDINSTDLDNLDEGIGDVDRALDEI